MSDPIQFRLFDSHCHLNLSQFDADRETVIKKMEAKSIAAVCVGVDQKSSKEAVEIARGSTHIYACVGQHPTDTREVFDVEAYRLLISDPRVVAIGECGLDYYRQTSDDDKVLQKELFLAHITLSLESGKPLMLHVRPSAGTMDAYEDALDILEKIKAEQGEKLRGNAHFFAGTLDIAKRFIAIGFTLSFPGVITFAGDYDEAVRYAPLDMILSETDSPYAAPVLYRGRRNEPAYVSEVVRRIAEIRGEDAEKVRLVTVQNALRFFNISG